MSDVDRIKKKLAELEAKGLLQRFLDDYKNDVLERTARRYKVNYMSTNEVKKYIQEQYGITHIPVKHKR